MEASSPVVRGGRMPAQTAKVVPMTTVNPTRVLTPASK